MYRPKEGLEVVLVYSNEGVQDRTRSEESQKQELSKESKEGDDRGDRANVWVI